MDPLPARTARVRVLLASVIVVCLVVGCAPDAGSREPSRGSASATADAPGGQTSRPGADAAAPTTTFPAEPAEIASPTPSRQASASPSATPLASPPQPTAVALDPPPRPGRFALDLYRDDHVPQYTAGMCVPASMQTMINMIEPGPADATRATQLELYRLARRWSPWLVNRPGASTEGWEGGLEQLGYGQFDTIPLDTRAEALRVAAQQMRMTRKPVGLLVWRGKHAWVMSGFKATADPALTDDFEVTAVWIEDPWYGRVSGLWGEGLPPHTLVDADDLGTDFMRWASRYRPEYGPRGRFVIVAPMS